MGKKGPLWWRESDWLLRGFSAANQILLRHSGPILSYIHIHGLVFYYSAMVAKTQHYWMFCDKMSDPQGKAKIVTGRWDLRILNS